MANEATVTSSLRVVAGNIQYQSLPQSFNATVTGRKGPTPGAITATVGGTIVDLSELVQPALCRIGNLDTANWIEYGMLDPDTQKFYPLGEVLPGESYVIRLSRNVQEEYDTGIATGTTGTARNQLLIRANAQSCVVVVEAFET